ncbi:site-specific DNA-methyltransferase [Streptomyces sp. WAC 00631]|uniref:site-specific DNA-methyltransferase n=1 Tax=Streptomyces sp. WAC 00631 TaxID=2203201 RepID=UPI000F792A15|nr:site-specific DNA-methyltransferase [Streptomyces sp. WAC 00631]MCC5035539.1 site-specific DNA-methyltransferase [Streptomyces sp. WAC 00631]
MRLPTAGLVVDPFTGSGVAGTAARRVGHAFYGVEAHPLIAELAALKLGRTSEDPNGLLVAARELTQQAITTRARIDISGEAELTLRSFDPDTLATLVSLRNSIRALQEHEWQLHLKWALLATLRDVASVRVGWPYQRPGSQRQPTFADPVSRFLQRAAWMVEDIREFEANYFSSPACRVRQGDSREAVSWSELGDGTAHGCVTSPPYLNNFDYADATRLELYFWGDVTSWSQMCTEVRSDMLTATTQQSSVGAASGARSLLHAYGTAGSEISEIADRLQKERANRSRGKEYDRVVPDYFVAIARILENLATVLAPGAPAVLLVGDSAPYGVYVDTPGLIAKLATRQGFTLQEDVILRHRGKRWARNATRHDVQLAERLVLLRRD